MSEAERFRIQDVLRIPEIRAAMLGTFVVMLGYGILSPVLPNYARSFGVGYDSIGLLISSFAFARLVSDPFVGRYIDRYGERAMSTLGAVWVGVSSFAAALAPTFPLLVLFRALGGVGSALFFASLLSFLLRSIPSRQTGRVMSVYYASFNIGFIAGGPLGGLMAKWFGLASPLYIYAGACFVAAVLFWRTIRNPERHESEVRRGGIRRLPWNRAFVTVLVVNGVYLWMIGAIFSTLVPLFGTSDLVGLTIGGVGIGLAIATATELAVLYPAGHATDRRGRRAVLIPALAGLALITARVRVRVHGARVHDRDGRARRRERLRGRSPRADAVGRDAGGAQGVGGRGVPVRRRPRVRDRAAGRRVVGAGVRVPRVVR